MPEMTTQVLLHMLEHGDPENSDGLARAMIAAAVSPVMGSFLRSWHDTLPPDERDGIKPLLPRLVDTPRPARSRGAASADRRRLIRWYLPNWLAAAGLMGHAMLVALVVLTVLVFAILTLASTGTFATD